MSSRDFRSPAIIRLSKGDIGLFESFVFNLYTAISHRRILSHSKAKEQLNFKVVSLGNITFGGSGKTPHVEFLANHFASKGVKAGIAAPGYKGKSRTTGALVSDGNKILINQKEAGDEAIMLASALLELNIPVFIHRNRIHSAKELHKLFGCELVILDDAFHYVSIMKDADICLINALNPFGGGSEFKKGAMREPVSALKRANAVIITHRALAGEQNFPALEKAVREADFEGPIFSSEYYPIRIEQIGNKDIDLNNAPKLNVIPVSGIGNPDAFEKSLNAIGINFSNPIRFNDHHEYSPNDIDEIKKAVNQDNKTGIITTKKDWIRLSKFASSFEFPVYILHSEIYIDEEYLAWLDKRLGS